MKTRFSRHRLIKLLFIVLAATVLVLSFLAYLQASFVIDLANRYILC